MFGNTIMKMMEDVEKNRAKDLGMSVEDYRNMLRKKEKQRKAEEERYLNSEQYIYDMKKKEEEELREQQDILHHMFQQPIAETVNINKTNLRKIIRWTSSKFNDYRKEEVIDLVLTEIERGENGFSEYSCGTYSDDIKNKKAKNYGFSQQLAILDGKIRWIDGYKCEYQKVYELKFRNK